MGLMILARAALAAFASLPAKPIAPNDILAQTSASSTTAGHAEEAHRVALTHYGYACWLQSNDRPASAWRQIQAAAKLEPDSLAILRERFRLERQFGRLGAAIFTARKILAQEPTDTATARDLAKLLYEVKFYDEAIQVLQTALTNPDVVEPRGAAKRLGMLNDLARIARAAEAYDKARDATQAALQLIQQEATNRVLGYFTTDAELQTAVLEKLEHLAAAYTNLKQFAPAREAYTQARRVAQGADDQIALARISYKLSYVWEAEENYEQAALQIQSFLRSATPNSTEPYERFAQMLRLANRPRAVVPELQALLAANSSPNRKYANWVLLVEQAKDDPTAWKRLEEIYYQTESEEFCKLFALAHRNADRTYDLLRILDESGSRFQEGEPAFLQRGSLRNRRALFDSIKNDERLGDALLRVGLNRQLAGRSDDVQELLVWLAERRNDYRVLEELLSYYIDTENDRLIQKYINVLRVQRKWQTILDLANRQTARRNANSLYWAFLRAEAMSEQGNVAAALKIYESLQQTLPVRARLAQATLLVQLGKPKEADEIMNDVLARELTAQERKQAYESLASIKAALKQYQQADEAYQAILDQEPDDVLTLNNYAYNLADQGRRLDEAEVMMRHAIELDRIERKRNGYVQEVRGTYLDSLGWVLFRRGKLQEAKQIFEQAIRTTEGISDAIVWDHYGDVLFRLDEKTEARAAWTRASELFSNTIQGRLQGRRAEILWKLSQ